MSNNPTTITSKEPLLTKQAIRKAIWQAVKTKTNYDLSGSSNTTNTGGIFTDSIWLRTNYDTNLHIQDVIGKLIKANNGNAYIDANLYNLSVSSKSSDTISLSSEQVQNLGIPNGTTLNRIPIADAKTILSKIIYDDAKILSIYNKLIDSEIADEIMEQKLMLAGYDIITASDNTIPSSATSSIYKYDDNQTPLNYSITVNNGNNTFTIPTTSSQTYTYYPDTIIVKTINSQQRYTTTSTTTTVDNIETTKYYITAINGTNLTEQIEIDFEYVPEYTLNIITKSG